MPALSPVFPGVPVSILVLCIEFAVLTPGPGHGHGRPVYGLLLVISVITAMLLASAMKEKMER